MMLKRIVKLVFFCSITAAMISAGQGGAEAQDETLDLVPRQTRDDESREIIASHIKEHELRGTFFYEDLSYDPADTKGGSFSATFRDLDRLTLFAESTYQNKFKDDELFFKFGGAYRTAEKLIFKEIIGTAPIRNTFPVFFSDSEFVYNVTENVSTHFGYMIDIFPDVKAHILYPGVTFYPHPQIYVHGKYFLSIFDFDEKSSLSSNNSYLVKVGFYMDKKNEFSAGYGRNSESFLTADKVGEFEANTYTGLWNFNLSGAWWLTTAFTYQDRVKPVAGHEVRTETGLIYKW